MSEREIRKILRQFCEDLDLRARSAARSGARKAAVPLMIGAGLLVTNCDDETETAEPVYGAPAGTPSATSTGSGTATGGGGDGGQTATGGSGGAGGGVAGEGGTPQIDYGGPDP